MHKQSSDSSECTEESQTFLSTFQPFGLEDLERQKSRRLYRPFSFSCLILVVAFATLLLGLTFLAIFVGIYEARGVPATPSAHASNQDKKQYLCPEGWTLKQGQVIFFVVGDWGSQGSSSQQKVAAMITDVAECLRPQFVISTGDNFYPSGISSAVDPQISSSFTNMYNSQYLQVPWYGVLGNHDYGDGLSKHLLKGCKSADGPPDQLLASCSGSSACCTSPSWQVAESPTDASPFGPRWHLQQGTYCASFPQGLEVTFVDTTPLLHKYHKEHWVDLIGGYSSQREDSVKESQRLLLESSLNSSTAKFKLVVGHHPVVSLGDNCQKDSDCDETSELFKPLLEQYNVTAYLNGHEHDLQYIESSEGGQHVVSYVVTGAGSDVAIDEFQQLRQKSIPEGPYFLRDDQGFVAVVLEGSSLDFYYYVSSSRLPAFKASREQK